MAVIDCVTFNGEFDMLNLRLRMLKNHVDEFVIVESFHTFTGIRKPLYFMEKARSYSKYNIRHHIIDERYSDEEIAQANSSPNTKGALHWKNEFLQKESIKKALEHLKDDDFVYIGDVDEIWDASIPQYKPLGRMKLRVYAYYLDNRSSEQFWGILRGRWGDMKNLCLNHFRSNGTLNEPEYGGWHFTSMGGLNEVRRKLNASYTTESYNTYEVQERLPERLRRGVDYLGRPFTFELQESEWPPYLKKHRGQFAHLCKGITLSPHEVPLKLTLPE